MNFAFFFLCICHIAISYIPILPLPQWTTETWTLGVDAIPAGHVPFPDTDMPAVVNQGWHVSDSSIIMYGGEGFNVQRDILSEYDIATGTWIVWSDHLFQSATLNPLPNQGAVPNLQFGPLVNPGARHFPSIVKSPFNDRLYLFGGLNLLNFLLTEEYDFSDLWEFRFDTLLNSSVVSVRHR